MVDWEKLTDRVRALIRAKQGLPKEDDYYQGLIHTEDARERSILSLHNIYRDNYMMLLNSSGGDEWEICGQLVDGELHLMVSKDGERANNFIMAKKKEETPVPVTNIMMQGQPQQPEPEKKKGFFHR